jgi:hypothetical protein
VSRDLIPTDHLHQAFDVSLAVVLQVRFATSVVLRLPELPWPGLPFRPLVRLYEWRWHPQVVLVENAQHCKKHSGCRESDMKIFSCSCCLLFSAARLCGVHPRLLDIHDLHQLPPRLVSGPGGCFLSIPMCLSIQ